MKIDESVEDTVILLSQFGCIFFGYLIRSEIWISALNASMLIDCNFRYFISLQALYFCRAPILLHCCWLVCKQIHLAVVKVLPKSNISSVVTTLPCLISFTGYSALIFFILSHLSRYFSQQTP